MDIFRSFQKLLLRGSGSMIAPPPRCLQSFPPRPARVFDLITSIYLTSI
nr:MAG TPA: hypothetical protein [Caudoviricetes sp.]